MICQNSYIIQTLSVMLTMYSIIMPITGQNVNSNISSRMAATTYDPHLDEHHTAKSLVQQNSHNSTHVGKHNHVFGAVTLHWIYSSYQQHRRCSFLVTNNVSPIQKFSRAM